MKKHLQFYCTFAFTAALVAPISVAQTGFERWYGDTADDGAFDVIETADGGFVMTGYHRTGPGALDDVWLIRTNASGDMMWGQTYGGADYDNGRSVRQTADGGYIIAGWTMSSGAGERDILLIKTDANGNALWEKTFGSASNDQAEAIRQTDDNGYIVAASSEDNILLIKTDASGELMWDRAFRKGVAFDDAGSIELTDDGGFIVTGGGNHIWLFKTDNTGTMEWEQVFFSPAGVGTGRSVQRTADGGYAVVGWVAVGLWDHDIFLGKTDAEGNVLLNKTIGHLDSIQDGESVQQTTDGGYIIAGLTDYGLGTQQDVYLVKTNASGDSVWTRTFGGDAFDEGYAVLQAQDGAYVVAGHTGSHNNGDAYLIKTGGGPVGIEDDDGLPLRAIESSTYPNPFVRRVEIAYTVPQTMDVQVRVYDALGRHVATLADRPHHAGRHRVEFEADQLPSGLYFTRFVTPTGVAVSTMTLLQ